MQKTVQAVYKAGVLQPLDPQPLAEMQQVSVTITGSPASGDDIADTKWEEARRVLVTLLRGDLPVVKVRAAEDFGQLLAGVPAGAWFAISHDKQRVVAYAAEMGEAISKAKELGEEDPIMVRRYHSRLPL
jgi:predicted DNA-binding antitoxin AbrB/MazE fold protein